MYIITTRAKACQYHTSLFNIQTVVITELALSLNVHCMGSCENQWEAVGVAL